MHLIPTATRSQRCLKPSLELLPEQSSALARKPSASRCEAQACPGATIAPQASLKLTSRAFDVLGALPVVREWTQ
jgi:hypothetical protein